MSQGRRGGCDLENVAALYARRREEDGARVLLTLASCPPSSIVGDVSSGPRRPASLASEVLYLSVYFVGWELPILLESSSAKEIGLYGPVEAKRLGDEFVAKAAVLR